MSFEPDQEILQDFLIEAGELLESLSEQLIDLEKSPSDPVLLNAVFRGFHTVKGGAGFLQLDSMVHLCHIAENVFDELRNHKIHLNPQVMDIILQTLDVLNQMFDVVKAGNYPDEADDLLLERLKKVAKGHFEVSGTDSGSAISRLEESNTVNESVIEEHLVPDEVLNEAQEEALQEIASIEVHAEDKIPEPIIQAKAPDLSQFTNVESDVISDDEFERLLDALQGAVHLEPVFKQQQADLRHALNHASVPEQEISIPKPPQKTEEEIDNELLALASGKTHKNPLLAQKTLTHEEIIPQKPKAVISDIGLNKAEEKPSIAMVTDDKKSANKDALAEVDSSVRVDTKRLDDIMNLVGELVLVRNRLVRLGGNFNDEPLSKAVSNLDVVTADLQMSVMKTRMQPIKKVFGRFPRVVRDLARTLKKEINLEMEGEETDLDKNLVEALADPLIHLVRNAVDHGIELPEEREQLGKSRVGQVLLSASQEGDQIVLVIRDDGRGMDPNVLRKKAVEKGLMDAEVAERLSDRDAYFLIFHPGFSTRDQISDVSGRGVGMDVVKTKISQLNGSIDLDSALGKGSEIRIKVPLTLAIMPTLMVKLDQQTFAFPLVNVNEIFLVDLNKINVVNGKELVTVRDKVIPLFHIKKWMLKNPIEQNAMQAQVVVVTVGTKRIAFVVDQLIGQEEVVIKPLGKILNGTPGIAGATITGDGRIALIFDISAMLKKYAA
jgi:two-component system chemotaxis sensor kinase CheA